MRTRKFIAVLAMTVPIALAGCSSGSGGASPSIAPPAGATFDARPVKAGGTINVALSQDPDALDPTTANTFVGREVFASICEKLYDIDENLKIVPQLAAAAPEVSADGKTVTIKLRTGVLFNDGTPMDATAVKKTLDRNRTKADSARRSELGAVSDVAVVDPSTVRLTLSRPFAPLAAQLADRAGMIMSPAALAAEGDNFGAKPVCVGPFSFVSRTSGSEIVVQKSDKYYNKDQVKLDKIVYKIITDSNVRAANLRSGDLQVAERLATNDVPAFQADSKFKLLVGGGLSYQGITLNAFNVAGTDKAPGTVNTPLGKSVQLREAFELSLDRDTINKVVFNGLYEADCNPLPMNSPYRDPAATCTKRDVAKAKQLVAASGVPTPIPVTLLITAAPVNQRLGEVVQGMAKEAGFDVKLQPTEFVTSLDQAKSGKFDAIQVGWSGRVDPDGNVNDLITTGGSNNYSGLHDPRIDDAIHQAAATTDDTKRRELYTTAIKAQQEQHCVIYLYHERYFLGTAGDIAGIRYYADGIPRFATAGFAA
ncbi:ABC transporter substrate-binding protein [Micromonospora sp. NPDC049559]|uniref:ABC transporter substrate-binding protein n=1 Tax=Micromonospora sp. NPDC049559 TaxID=3155923 RepID=UPI00341BBE35